MFPLACPQRSIFCSRTNREGTLHSTKTHACNCFARPENDRQPEQTGLKAKLTAMHAAAFTSSSKGKLKHVFTILSEES